jgi:plasmid maintenance system antidote protein VapI
MTEPRTREAIVKELLTRNLSIQFWLRLQTPPEVWQEYRANGYTYEQAMNEELSYL